MAFSAEETSSRFTVTSDAELKWPVLKWPVRLYSNCNATFICKNQTPMPRIPTYFLRLALTLALIAFSLNASAGLFDDEEARRDIKNLRAQTDQQNRDIDGRLQRLEESI